MKKNKVSIQMVSYELRNISGNPFVHIFGIGFPILLAILISKGVSSDITNETYLKQAVTMIFLGIGSIIPMATIFMGYASTASIDLEKGIPLRMQLFGFEEKYTILNRLMAEFVYMTFAFVLYGIVGYFMLQINVPTIQGFLMYILCIYVFSGVLFIMAHAIANLVQKFGLTYMITMILYFGMMILSGMMGISTDQLPKPVKLLANLLPSTYFQKDFYKVWMGKSYNYMPMLQAYIFFIAIAGILLFFMIYRLKRNISRT